MEINTDDFFNYSVLPLLDEIEEKETDALQSAEQAIHGGIATAAGQKTKSLQQMMDSYALALKDFALKSDGTPVRANPVQYKGFAAEEFFKLTAKINGLADGTWSWQFGAYTYGALPDDSVLSRIDMHDDIIGFSRKWPWEKPKRVANYQAKIHNDARKYRADWEKPQYAASSKVGGAGQGVNDTIKIPVPGGEAVSDSGTPEFFTDLATKMINQDVPEYEYREQKLDTLGHRNVEMAVKAGAITGFMCSSTQEILRLWQKREDLTRDDFVNATVGILCGTAEGGIRGGSIVASVQVFSKIIGKEIAENSFEAVIPMAITNATFDFAKDLYSCLITKEMDKDELLCKTVTNGFFSSVQFLGNWALGKAGEQIGWSLKKMTTSHVAGSTTPMETVASTTASIGSAFGPAGAVVTTIVGSYILNAAAEWIISEGDKEAIKAVDNCIAEMNANLEVNGFERYSFYVDGLSELSDPKLSFKTLLPCYSLIADLKEYNYRKKMLQQIRAQVLVLPDVETVKKQKLQELDQTYLHSISLLENEFQKKRQMMEHGLRKELENYMQVSYQQYLIVSSAMTLDLEQALQRSRGRLSWHAEAVIELQAKRDLDEELNNLLLDLMKDSESSDLLKPFINYLLTIMENDSIATGKQYISVAEAMDLVKGGNTR